MRVLIAEDEAVSRAVLTRTLTALGHQPICASNGAEAWELLQSEPFAVVISDWIMPLVDGLELCTRIRHSGADSYTYFILLTARTERDDRLEASAHEVDDFLSKPLDRFELAACLRTAVRILSWQQQLQDVNSMLLAKSLAVERHAAELEVLRRKSDYLAAHDTLTGALNRRAWFAAAEHQALRAVAVFDIDHFKAVNDRLGHPAGDSVIRQVSRRIARVLEPAASFGRIGGEEFAAGFFASPDEALALCEAALSAVGEEPVRLPDGSTVSVTISAGLAPSTVTSLPPADLVAYLYEAADKALYAAKRSGRARLSLAEPRAA